jgi:hypothetical protein
MSSPVSNARDSPLLRSSDAAAEARLASRTSVQSGVGCAPLAQVETSARFSQMWLGTRQAISLSPMAPATRASPSSIRTASFLKSWGKRGTGPGEFANVLSIAVDAHGNVYAGDGGNRRIQVFDNNGVFKTAFSNFGNAQAILYHQGSESSPLYFQFQSVERYRCRG